MNAADNYVTPGWDDLLRLTEASFSNGDTLSDEDLSRVHSGASNVRLAIVQGMAAIGEIQCMACDNADGPVDLRTFRQLGVLNACLAELLENLATMENNAAFLRHERALAASTGKKKAA